MRPPAPADPATVAERAPAADAAAPGDAAPARPPDAAQAGPAARSSRPARLTSRQRCIKDALIRFFAERGRFPTIRELCAVSGLRSTSTAHAHIAALRRAGILRHDDPRHIALAPAAMPELASAIATALGGHDHA